MTARQIYDRLDALGREADDAGYTLLAAVIKFAANCASEQMRGPLPPPPRARRPRLSVIAGGRE